MRVRVTPGAPLGDMDAAAKTRTAVFYTFYCMKTRSYMDHNDKPQILLTNDDGIRSPGLWAAAEALSEVGYVHVVAPRDQSSGTGRSYPITSDGTISQQTLEINGQTWQVFAVSFCLIFQ